MTPRLTVNQGRIVRALALYLSTDSKSLMKDFPDDALVVESITSRPWSSLTFAGDRHHVVVRLPRQINADSHVGLTIDGTDLVVAGAIVAVEQAAWRTTTDGIRLTLQLLAITAPPAG